MSLRGLKGEELKRHLRELVTSWEGIIRDAGSLGQAEETLLHLEENDENFHKHEFVKALKRELEQTLSPLIEDELEKYSTTGHVDSGSHETLVSRITDHIIQSRQYGELKKSLGKNMSEAVDDLLANFDSEFVVGKFGGEVEGLEPRITPLVTDDEEGSVMIFHQDHLKGIADNLGKTKSPEVQREAMQKLNQIISGEIVHNKHWQQLRKNLMDVMADPDQQLSELSLKFVAKSFTCTSHHTSQVYTLLIGFLCSQFSGMNASMPPVKNGLDCSNKTTVKLLKAFRLMIEFQHEAPNYWVRYPMTYLEEIVESSLNLFSLQMVTQAPLTKLSPLHFVAVLDPKAQWFIKWMHGNYSRKILLELLEKYRVIVETSLRHCLDFSAFRKSSLDSMSEVSDAFSKVSVTDHGQRLFYTGPELEYALFIHSLSFLGRLLCFKKGQQFFPVRFREKQVPVSITQLLKALVLLVVDPGMSAAHRRVEKDKDTFEFTTLVTEVLRSLCATEQVCSSIMCRDEIISTLLSPVSQYMDESPDHIPPGEDTLVHVANILCVIASSTKGRRYLLYGEGQSIHSRTKSSSAHQIAEFTKKSLSNTLSKSYVPPSNNVVGVYLYICRQLYNTCEGLFVLSSYELHNSIAQAWKQVQALEKSSSSVASSVKGDELDKYTSESWKGTLQDNLLNFASTAKGILLLHQTGAFNESVRYMYSRYAKKLQVGICEKFGYGYMVTQVAATALGIQALQSTGYIKALLVELWSALECGPQDIPVFTPKSWPVDPIDRASQKHFIRLVNILSAFPAVYELLKGQPLPSRETYSLRDIPNSITALIDRIIFVDSAAKIHSLFNYEQSYTFGLRVLSVMVSCLDTYLLLQSQYKFQEFLLAEQEANKVEDSERFICDVLSVERNYILVKTFLIGGPTERTLPSRTLEEDKSGNLKLPILFSSYPIPREYQPNVAGRSAMKQENELSKFLNASRPEKKAKVWMDKCRNLLHKMLESKPDHAKGNLLQQLLEMSVSHMNQMQEEAIFHLFDFSGTDSTIKNFKLSPLQLLGIKTAVRYGIHLKVINTSSESTENLTQLLKLSGCFLKQQMRSLKTSLQYLEGTYPGFDWFVATIFLIFNGNGERTWNFLHKFSALGCSGYMWMARLHASTIPSGLLSSGISPMFSSTAHNIELLLQTELPLIASAFKMSGYTPSQICMHWLTQCFWNYLDWLDIVHYIVICVVLGVDYQVYLCVAILKHLQRDIFSHMQTQDLIIFLKEEAICNFHILDQMDYMKELEKKYRKIILADMMNITKP
ncbi:protein broad-minded [Aplysia californica]|uniref:Protein broad-minded n=1 Tax=Aplysia californica TaxID=6500 RepID=A0ABM0ZXW6_APLCA|nr:protein broad-minded [Aplysia californica]